MTRLTFSIVTPSFNHAPFIGATIDSVLSQDCPGLDYLVVDGASTDGTVEILSRYGPRLRWVSQPDRGQADAVNKGFANTRGDILGWLNSDDTYAAGALAAVAEIFQARPDLGVVYGDCDFIDDSGRHIGRCAHIEPFDRHRLLHHGDYIVQPAAFFRRDIFEQVGGLDASLHWAMDYDFWLKAAAVTRFAYLPRTLAHYRWLGRSKTASSGRDRLAEVQCVVARYGLGGLPTCFRLEAVRLHWSEMIEALRHRRFRPAATGAMQAAVALLTSPPAMLSLLSIQTWQTIRMGQILRRTDRTIADAV